MRKANGYTGVLLVALGVAIGLLGAPSTASAGGWDVDYAVQFPFTYTAQATEPKITTANRTVSCKLEETHGEYQTATTGELEITYRNCTGPLGFACTTPGQPSGTITTTKMVFHNVMIDSTAQANGGTAGTLITTNGGHFATYECLLVGKAVIGGNGIMGDLKSPKCGESSNEWTFVYESASPGIQKWMQVTTEGTQFDLSTVVNGVAETTSIDSDTSLKLIEMGKVTCP